MANTKIKRKVSRVNESISDLAGTADADHELQMARSQLYRIAEYAIKLHDLMKTLPDTYDLEAWQQAKITKAADYMDTVYHNLEYKIKAKGEINMPGGMPSSEITVGEGRFDNRSGGVMGGPAKRDQMGKDIAYDTKDDEKAGSINTARKMSKMSPHYMLINGKLWKKDGQPVEFRNFDAAGKAANTIRKKYPDKKVQITTKSSDPTTESVRRKFAGRLGAKLAERSISRDKGTGMSSDNFQESRTRKKK